MATSKTLNPTNTTVQIPAMTDVPDASVFANTVSATVDAVNALLTNTAKRTAISNTSTNFTEVYEFSNGLAILCARITVSVSITSASGGIYWGEVPAQDWGYTFADQPTVMVSSRGASTNGFIWQYGSPTTTKSPTCYIGRGTSASGNVVMIYIAIGRKAS